MQGADILDGLSSGSTFLSLESEAGWLCLSALSLPCWPGPQGRTENGITTTMAFGIYSSAFPTGPFNSNSNPKQVYQVSSPEHPSASRHCVRNDLSGKTTAGIRLFRSISCQHSHPC